MNITFSFPLLHFLRRLSIFFPFSLFFFPFSFISFFFHLLHVLQNGYMRKSNTEDKSTLALMRENASQEINTQWPTENSGGEYSDISQRCQLDTRSELQAWTRVIASLVEVYILYLGDKENWLYWLRKKKCFFIYIAEKFGNEYAFVGE